MYGLGYVTSNPFLFFFFLFLFAATIYQPYILFTALGSETTRGIV
jgi:hypothetical protein